MADLDVQPKRSSPWWLWVLILLIVLVVLFFLFKGRDSKPTQLSTTDSTQTDTATAGNSIAITAPDWNGVDFNAPKLADENVTDPAVIVSGNEKYTIYTLGENILFATDQNAVQSSATDKLNQIVASLNKHFKGADIGVYGSTDSTGTAGHNKELGAERAAAVKNWLVKNGSLDASKVTIHSLGESKPVATNATASGREQNRNVAIVAFPGK